MIMNRIHNTPLRSDLMDRFFQISLQTLIKERSPYILSAFLDALSAGLKIKTANLIFEVNMRAMDVCQSIMIVTKYRIIAI